MRDAIRREYLEAIARYDPRLLEATADHATRLARSRKKDPAVRLEQVLANPQVVGKLTADLDSAARQALTLFRRCPWIWWNWDDAVRLLTACEVQAPYEAIQSLLAEGLLVLRPGPGQDRIERFRFADGIPVESLPSVAIAAPLLDHPPAADLPIAPLRGKAAPGPWRWADGWEIPLRLAFLWRLAWLAPFKRTQQDRLFKRDYERLTFNPILGAPMLDEPVPIRDSGLLVYALADRAGWLAGPDGDEIPLLWEVWPDTPSGLLLLCARHLLRVTLWSELPDSLLREGLARESASARFLLLLWLATLEADRGAPISQLSERLVRSHPPWNARGELIGPLRQAPDRARLAQEWTRVWLLGPMYQCGLVATAGPPDDPLVRLTDLGRRFLGESIEIPAPPSHSRTLLVQPNHEIVVYRQGLTVPLLCSLVRFTDPRSVGAALLLEMTPQSVYHGLELGMTPEEMTSLLEERGGQPLPSAVAASIRTWAQKRDRIRIFANASLLEFEHPGDLQAAMKRGLEGEPLTDRILLVAGRPEASLGNLRITAARDYRIRPEACVEVAPDGVTFRVDAQKSDLLLEAELERFADALPSRGYGAAREYRVTSQSLGRAFGQGLRPAFVEDWYLRRTGAAAPSSVLLLLRAAAGLVVAARPALVLWVDSPAIADGLLQHPSTKTLVGPRLGPLALTVPDENLDLLRRTLADLGIDLSLEAPSKG